MGFTANGEADPVVVPPEGVPDIKIEHKVSGTTGPLSIKKAATMNFGSQVISNRDQTYNMIVEKQQKAVRLVKKTKSLMSVLRKCKMFVGRILIGI
ncbi:WxL domain-containing protein [Enterococcus casseliflavus]|uniref:WxL domain-containing protein n=1 Tax=Enterococcus casseliflavus TaxID=37734 RepID=UPI0039A4B8A7